MNTSTPKDVGLSAARSDYGPAAVPSRPSGTRIQVIDHGEGVTILVPPPRPCRRIVLLMTMGILFCLPAPPTILWIICSLPDGPVSPSSESPVVAVLGFEMPIFLFPAGVALLLQGLIYLRNHFEVSVSSEHVRFTQVGLFGELRRLWPREAVLRISVEGGPRMAKLCIYGIQGRPVKASNFEGALPSPTREEWDWVAALLRQYLARSTTVGAHDPRTGSSSDGITPGETGVARP